MPQADEDDEVLGTNPSLPDLRPFSSAVANTHGGSEAIAEEAGEGGDGMIDGEDKAIAEDGAAGDAEVEEAGSTEGASSGLWGTAPNASLGLAPWPPEFLAQQGPAPVVPLGLHAAGRPRITMQVALSELVGAVQLQAAVSWGVAPTEFRLALRGVVLDPGFPLVHYFNAGAVLEAVAPGPR